MPSLFVKIDIQSRLSLLINFGNISNYFSQFLHHINKLRHFKHFLNLYANLHITFRFVI